VEAKSGIGLPQGLLQQAPLICRPMAPTLRRGWRCCYPFRSSWIPISRSAYRLLDLLFNYSNSHRNDGPQERIA
jgi:hypothetical protein